LSTFEGLDRGEVEHLARSQHRTGPRGKLGLIEAVEENRHRHRRHLIVGDFSLGVAGEKPRDLIGCQHTAIPLPLD
jgi:hypothetical protein